MLNFSSYTREYDQYSKILNESPMSTGKSYGDLFDNDIINREHTLKILDKYQKESTFIRGDITFEIWVDNINTLKELFIIDQRYPQIVAYVYYNVVNNIVEEKGIWNKRNYPGLIRYLYVNCLMNNYDAIVSDSLHSAQAKRMWEWLYNDNKLKYKFKIFDSINGTTKPIFDINDIDKLYSNHTQHLRIMMSN